MSGTSKQQANYRYPEKCCGYCRAAYQSSYGDYQCNWLEAGNTIDLGGVCDLFVQDGPAVDRGRPEDEPEGNMGNAETDTAGAGPEGSDKDVFGTLA
jgi:hypothetical protein